MELAITNLIKNISGQNADLNQLDFIKSLISNSALQPIYTRESDLVQKIQTNFLTFTDDGGLLEPNSRNLHICESRAKRFQLLYQRLKNNTQITPETRYRVLYVLWQNTRNAKYKSHSTMENAFTKEGNLNQISTEKKREGKEEKIDYEINNNRQKLQLTNKKRIHKKKNKENGLGEFGGFFKSFQQVTDSIFIKYATTQKEESSTSSYDITESEEEEWENGKKGFKLTAEKGHSDNRTRKTLDDKKDSIAIPDNKIVLDLLAIMHGHQGVYVTFVHTPGTGICTVSASTMSSTERYKFTPQQTSTIDIVLPITGMVKRLQELTTLTTLGSSQKNQVRIALSEIISGAVGKYFQCLSSLELRNINHTLSIQDIAVSVSALKTELSILYDLAESILGNSELRGISICNMIYRKSLQVGQESELILKRCLAAASEPIFVALRRWSVEGILDSFEYQKSPQNSTIEIVSNPEYNIMSILNTGNERNKIQSREFASVKSKNNEFFVERLPLSTIESGNNKHISWYCKYGFNLLQIPRSWLTPRLVYLGFLAGRCISFIKSECQDSLWSLPDPLLKEIEVSKYFSFFDQRGNLRSIEEIHTILENVFEKIIINARAKIVSCLFDASHLTQFLYGAYCIFIGAQGDFMRYLIEQYTSEFGSCNYISNSSPLVYTPESKSTSSIKILTPNVVYLPTLNIYMQNTEDVFSTLKALNLQSNTATFSSSLEAMNSQKFYEISAINCFDRCVSQTNAILLPKYVLKCFGVDIKSSSSFVLKFNTNSPIDSFMSTQNIYIYQCIFRVQWLIHECDMVLGKLWSLSNTVLRSVASYLKYKNKILTITINNNGGSISSNSGIISEMKKKLSYYQQIEKVVIKFASFRTKAHHFIIALQHYLTHEAFEPGWAKMQQTMKNIYSSLKNVKNLNVSPNIDFNNNNNDEKNNINNNSHNNYNQEISENRPIEKEDNVYKLSDNTLKLENADVVNLIVTTHDTFLAEIARKLLLSGLVEKIMNSSTPQPVATISNKNAKNTKTEAEASLIFHKAFEDLTTLLFAFSSQATTIMTRLEKLIEDEKWLDVNEESALLNSTTIGDTQFLRKKNSIDAEKAFIEPEAANMLVENFSAQFNTSVEKMSKELLDISKMNVINTIGYNQNELEFLSSRFQSIISNIDDNQGYDSITSN